MTGFVYVVDDDENVRNSVRALLGSRRNLIVQVFATGNAFLSSMEDREPGVVLLDIHMPGLSGIDVLRELFDRRETFPVVVLTGQGDLPLGIQAMKLGAVDFIEKPYDFLALFTALDEAMARVQRVGNQAARAADARKRVAQLTEREKEVLHEIVNGASNKGIAETLHVSVRTVEVFRANMMTKLHAKSLHDVLRIAFGAGMGGSIFG